MKQNFASLFVRSTLLYVFHNHVVDYQIYLSFKYCLSYNIEVFIMYNLYHDVISIYKFYLKY